MRVSPTIALEEMVRILREALALQLGCGIDDIQIESYDAVKITIYADGMVDAAAFQHKAHV